MLPGGVVEEVAAHLGEVRQAEPDVECHPLRLHHADGVAPRAGGAGERTLDLAIAALDAPQQPGLHGFVPAGRREPLIALTALTASGRRRRPGGGGARVAEPGQRHPARRLHDAAIDRERGHGTGRHAIHDRPAVGAHGGTPGAAGLHIVADRQALALRRERRELRLPLLDREDRFASREQPHVEEVAAHVDGHQQVDRLAAVTGAELEIDGLEHLADEFGPGRFTPEDRPCGQLQTLLADHQWRREARRQAARLIGPATLTRGAPASEMFAISASLQPTLCHR